MNREGTHCLSIQLKWLTQPLGMVVLALGIEIAAFPAPVSARTKHYLLGNSVYVNPFLSGVAYHLLGRADVDAAIQWMINQVRGCSDCTTTVDVVVIRC